MLGWGGARAFILFHQWVNDRGMFWGCGTAALESRVRGGSRVQVGAGGGKQKECDAHTQLEPPLLHWQLPGLWLGNPASHAKSWKTDTGV